MGLHFVSEGVREKKPPLVIGAELFRIKLNEIDEIKLALFTRLRIQCCFSLSMHSVSSFSAEDRLEGTKYYWGHVSTGSVPTALSHRHPASTTQRQISTSALLWYCEGY